MACIDLGVEPAHMSDLFSIFMNDSMDTANMKGMLQVIASPPLTPRQMADLTLKRMDTENSVGLVEFGNGASQQSIACTVHITQAAMDLVRESPVWVRTSAITGRSTEVLFNIETCMECSHDPLATTSGAYLLEERVFKVVQDTSQLMGVRSDKGSGRGAPNVGHGIGMAFGLLIVIVLASICQHQFFFRSMITSVLACNALTGALYRPAVQLTPVARLRLPNSVVLSHLSTDVSRVDACAQWLHAAWAAPIQTRPSALAGFALFLPIIPLQERIVTHQFSLRQASMKWTDERAGRVLEVVASMRVVKSFCYERSFLARLFRICTQELRGIRKIQHSQSANVGERSVFSLARALVKDSRVVILDEATASVDLETDNKIQRMIQTQFKDRTLICIVHRLRTIIWYDRILVLDAGKIAEFDTPLNLFNRNESLFRSLCNKSNITSGDIEKAIISDDVE
ncbi:hypothetical protein B0H13DRAFT_2676788 [Mycena leptocephala]|nr:hypothetical protein B0H13DRAFT_2676788 [Mycena leptocephala]